MSNSKTWFPTLIYHAPVLKKGGEALVAELHKEVLQIRDFDLPGQHWSARNYPAGYTSYGSMDSLNRFSSTFLALQKHIDRHVKSFVADLSWNLQGRKLLMTDCWANVMPRGCAHSFHIHPQAVISGTYYVVMPTGAPGLKFEDPRLAFMMAAPARLPDVAANQQAHITYDAKAGDVILFESWLRHEVPCNLANQDRISISFNYHWI